MSEIKVNIGPGPHNAEGWLNLDVVETETIKPDMIYDGVTLPFEDSSIDDFYVAHILEHIVWEEVPAFIDELHRTLKPGGKMAVLGPDMMLGLDLWRKGKLQLHFDDKDPGLLGMLEWPHLPNWDAPRHFWNCYEERVVSLFVPTKWSVDRVGIGSSKLNEYPVVSRAPWQMAIIVTKI